MGSYGDRLSMIPLEDLLNDPRVQILLTAARHAHIALIKTAQRRVADNLDFALKPFESDDRPTIPPPPDIDD